MASESFSYMYQVDDGDVLLTPVVGSPFVVAETSDDDGVFRLNEEIEGGLYLFKGYTADGSILLLNQVENKYYYYSNSGSLEGAPLSSLSLIEQDYIFCFARGTLISTASGVIAVEQLAIDDEVLNAAGAVVKVKWIGRQTRNPLFAKVDNHLPVCISQGALGDGLPLRDLYVSPDHAMLVQGCLVHASALLNGRTITQVKEWQGNIEYYHIETEHHELVLAEGAAAETFVDNVSREKFDNYAEFAALYPDAQPIAELDLPRVCFQRQLPKAISRELDAIADSLTGELAAAA